MVLQLLPGTAPASEPQIGSQYRTQTGATKHIQPSASYWATLSRQYDLTDYFGITVAFELYEPALYPSLVKRLKQLGVKHVRIPIHWWYLEPQRGKLDAAYLAHLDAAMNELDKNGISTVMFFSGSTPWNTTDPAKTSDRYPPLDFADYLSRAKWLVERYPRLEGMQIWNEPNSAGCWAPREQPGRYATLLAQAYDTLKASHPGLVVGAAGMSYYSNMPCENGLMLEALARKGAFKKCDSVAYHPYFARPEGNNNSDSPGDFIRTASWLNTQLRLLGAKRLWASEWGWSTYSGAVEEQPLISPREQADYILRRLSLLIGLDFDRVYLFDLADFPSAWKGRDACYGIVDNSAREKPSFLALHYFLTLLGGKLSPAKLPPLSVNEQGLYCTALKRPDGDTLLLVWAQSRRRCSLNGINQIIVHNPLDQNCKVISGSGRVEFVVEPTIQVIRIAADTIK